MHKSGVRLRSRRALCAGVVGALVGGVLALVNAAPATAAFTKDVYAVQRAYTDSRAPEKTFIDRDVDVPIGAWRDENGKVHRSRAYFTFDLSEFRGKRIVSAGIVAHETRANDCSKPRNWELWRTDHITASTSWAAPPKKRAKLAVIGGTGCPARVGQDVTEAVREAIATRRAKLTLAFMVPAEVERNVDLGRHVSRHMVMYVDSNLPPGTPTGLVVDDKPCAPGEPILIPMSGWEPTPIRVDVTDPDVEYRTGRRQMVSATFAVWPVDTPTARVEWKAYLPEQAPATVVDAIPPGTLQSGVTYAAAAKATDEDDDSSDWSAPCLFTVDGELPSAAPVVTSTDYPQSGSHGGPGIPGKFTFSANGVSDVAGFIYGISTPHTYVPADRLGGSATVTITPNDEDDNRLLVVSVDRVGNRSPMTDYTFQVRRTAPVIHDNDPDAWAGEPRRVTFRPGMENVVSYTYRIDDGPATVLAADANGEAELTVVPNTSGSTIYAYSLNRAGQRSTENWRALSVITVPVVSSTDFPFDGTPGLPVGSTGTITFKPRMHGVVDYVYQFNRGRAGETSQATIAAGPDGSATVQFTATQDGYNYLNIYSRSAAGVRSAEASMLFRVRSIAPHVSSPTYPRGQVSGGPGIPGTFLFKPVATDVVEYTYAFNGETAHTVPARADGTADIEWRPGTGSDTVTLVVRSRSSNGLVSDATYYTFYVRAAA